jgi:hypothetical protein
MSAFIKRRFELNRPVKKLVMFRVEDIEELADHMQWIWDRLGFDNVAVDPEHDPERVHHWREHRWA